MNYYIYKSESAYLMHHGIKGQKWGQKNGPPYPIGSSGHSAREEKAGWRSSLDKTAYKQAKKNKREAKKAYEKAYNKASNYSSLHPISQFIKGTKSNKKSTELWRDERLKNKSYEQAVKELNAARSDYRKQKAEVNTKHIAKTLCISEKEAEQVKKYAKVVGISLATTAGLVAAGYLLSRNKQALSTLGDNLINRGKNFIEAGKEGLSQVNKSGKTNFSYKISDAHLFDGRTLGNTAHLNGYREITADRIRRAIDHPEIRTNFDRLIKDVAVNQRDFGARRRLSCWSASEAYWLSSLTGKDFCSVSFENLVDFNDFKTLYKTQPKIFDAFGNEAKDFVGKYGRGDARIKFDVDKGKDLVSNVFKNIGASNNTTADGRTTIGFMNGAYRSMACTHQWNFEITTTSKGRQILNIADGWSGERYTIANRSPKGVISFIGGNDPDKGFNKFMQELYHYNADSLRFYAPSLDSVDPEALEKIVFGRY